MHRSKELAFLADIIAALAAGPPPALSMTKRLLTNSFSMSMDEALEYPGDIPSAGGRGGAQHHTHDRGGAPAPPGHPERQGGLGGSARPPHVQLVPTQPDSETSTITLSGPLYFTSTLA
jgi:hypothetical protein